MQTSSVLNGSSNEKSDVVAVVLAAGFGKRMQTELPKVAHTLLGKPLVYWCLDTLVAAGVRNIVLVLSPQQSVVTELVKNYARPENVHVEVAYQHNPQGTGHAVMSATQKIDELLERQKRSSKNASVLVSLSDMPAVPARTFDDYLNLHRNNRNDVTLMGFLPDDNFGYGRILTTNAGEFLGNREHKDCSVEEQKVRLCNSGFLCAKYDALKTLLPMLDNKNAGNEYYLTDVPNIAKNKGYRLGIFTAPHANELAGINSQAQLAGVAKFMQKRVIQNWLEKGVQFLDPEAVYVEESVEFAPGVVVEPFVYLAGKSSFPKGTRILSGSRIVDGKKS